MLPRPTTTTEPETSTIVDVEYVLISDEELDKPYRVIIENDDVTPMEFVVDVLLIVFGLTMTRAFRIMLEAHHSGHAHVVTLPLREAQERVYTAQSIARDAGYPLSFYIEPEA